MDLSQNVDSDKTLPTPMEVESISRDEYEKVLSENITDSQRFRIAHEFYDVPAAAMLNRIYGSAIPEKLFFYKIKTASDKTLYAMIEKGGYYLIYDEEANKVSAFSQGMFGSKLLEATVTGDEIDVEYKAGYKDYYKDAAIYGIPLGGGQPTITEYHSRVTKVGSPVDISKRIYHPMYGDDMTPKITLDNESKDDRSENGYIEYCFYSAQDVELSKEPPMVHTHWKYYFLDPESNLYYDEEKKSDKIHDALLTFRPKRGLSLQQIYSKYNIPQCLQYTPSMKERLSQAIQIALNASFPIGELLDVVRAIQLFNEKTTDSPSKEDSPTHMVIYPEDIASGLINHRSNKAPSKKTTVIPDGQIDDK